MLASVETWMAAGAGGLLAALAPALYAWRQRRRIRELERQIARLESEAAAQLQTDPLTELANRTALERWMEQVQPFAGLLAVCDLDNFKELNDRYGHLVGDEILRDIGQLIRASIRHDDRAFRWGGDEFVICFRTEDRVLVEDRLRSLERRLAQFYIRHHGPVSLRLSWGVAAMAAGEPARPSLEEADRRMLETKRQRRLTASAGGGPLRLT
jgi:diguanylate cyclase (GGDEF)-like protein